MPKGKVNVVHCIPVPAANSVAIRAQLVCQDEDGVQYTCTVTRLNEDLEPYCADQSLTYDEWRKAVYDHDNWRLIDWHSINLESDYRSRLTPEQAYEKHYEQRNR